MSGNSSQNFGNDQFSLPDRDIDAADQIATTLAGILPNNAISFLINQNTSQSKTKQVERLSHITTLDVERFLPQSGIHHLQTFLRGKVIEILRANPDTQTYQARYELCGYQLAQENNPLLPYIRPYLEKDTDDDQND